MGLRLLFILVMLGVSPALGQTVSELYPKVKSRDFVTRIERFGALLVGKPFMEAPLGDGPLDRFDQGPLHRLDAFDCTTFVETVLALAGAPSADRFQQTLNAIRYRTGKPSFVNRNHFPCVDWIPNLIERGLARDITQAVATPWGIAIASSVLDKRAWYANLPPTVIRIEGADEQTREARWRELQKQGTRFEPLEASIKYLPLDKIITRNRPTEIQLAERKQEEKTLEERRRTEGASDEDIHHEVVDLRLKYVLEESTVDPAFLESVPSGTIVNVVRPGLSIPGTKMNISHQGFIIRHDGAAFFRHVSRTSNRVKDVTLANYLRLLLLTPPVKGIHLLQPLPPVEPGTSLAASPSKGDSNGKTNHEKRRSRKPR